MGPKEFSWARYAGADRWREHRGELDEEKPPCRAMQGEVGKHSGESEAYTNLAGGWKEGTLLVGGEEAGEA